MPTIIYDVTVYSETETIANGYVKIEAQTITEMGPISQYQSSEDDTIITGTPGSMLVPGAIDVHIHGAQGADVMDGTTASLEKMARALPAEGTTSFLATTITQAPAQISQALKTAGAYQQLQRSGMAEVLGIHLEGPFISPTHAGAQPEAYITAPDIAQFEMWQTLSNNSIKLVTLAPEQPEGNCFVKHLAGTGVVASIGHSDATFDEVKQAIRNGATHITHLYNGMRGLHHREPGVVGSAYLSHELYVELIADGIHCRPEMVALAYKQISSDRLILITDSMRAKGLEDGTYDLGGQQVHVRGKQATLENGTLAGSILTMNEARKNLLSYTDCSIEDMIKMTAENPAKQLQLFATKGSIAVSKDADLVLLDKDVNVEMTFCRGTLAYKK